MVTSVSLGVLDVPLGSLMVLRCPLVDDWADDVLYSIWSSDRAVPLLRHCLYLKHERRRPPASCRLLHLSSHHCPVCDPLPPRYLYLRIGPRQE